MSDVIELSDHTWKNALTRTKEDKIAKDIGNAVIFLLNHAQWRKCLAYDEFSDRVFWAKRAPEMDASVFESPALNAEVSDRDCAYVHHWFARVVGVQFSLDILMRAIEVAAHQNNTCPPKTYLRSLKWDGVKRLDTMFREYFGAEQSKYSQCIGRWWMISAVARMLEPGCKADCILILQGKQGARKSSALGVLGGKWYSNSLPDVTSKDAQISLFGSWLIEIPELEAMNRSTATAFKEFSARTFDKFRKPYSRFETIHQRTCVFAGTTNDDKVLSDPTGARRFWPIHVAAHGKVIDLKALTRDRDQLWAEAVQAFESGEQWWPTDEMLEIITAEQDSRFSEDVWFFPIAEWCAGQEEERKRETFTTGEILSCALMLEKAKHDISSGMRISKIMRRLEYPMTGRKVVAGKKFAVYSAKWVAEPGAQLPMREPGED